LKFGGMLLDTYKHLFYNLRQFVSVDWQKSGLNRDPPNSFHIAPFDPLPKNFNFVDYYRKAIVLTDIFHAERLFPTFLVWAP